MHQELLALSGEKAGQSEDEEKAAVEAANQKKNDKGDTAEEKSEAKLPNQGIGRGNIKEAPPVGAGKPIGTNKETGVRVHIDGNGNIHGYPVDPSQYLK